MSNQYILCYVSKFTSFKCCLFAKLYLPHNAGTCFSLQLSSIPPYLQVIQFRVYVRQPGYYRSYIYRTVVDATTTVFNYTLTGLSINETYEFRVNADGEYRWCYRDIIGNASEPVNITTAAKGKFIFLIT